MEKTCRDTHIALIQCGMATIGNKLVEAASTGSLEHDCLALKLKILSKYRKMLYCYKALDCELTFLYAFDISGFSATDLLTAENNLDVLGIYDYIASTDGNTLYVYSCNVSANLADVITAITGAVDAVSSPVFSVLQGTVTFPGGGNFTITPTFTGTPTTITGIIFGTTAAQFAALIASTISTVYGFDSYAVGANLYINVPAGSYATYNSKAIFISITGGVLISSASTTFSGGVDPIRPSTYTNVISNPGVLLDLWNCITYEEICGIIGHSYSLIDSVTT